MKQTVLVLIVILALLFSSLAGSIAVGNPIAAYQLVKTHPNSWITKSPIPKEDIGYKAAMEYAAIYVIGNSSNYVYDPATDKWTAKTPMPTPRSDFALVACQNKIYVIGGNNGSDLERNFQSSYSVNEMYDPITDTWSTKASMPTNRSQMNAETVNGRIYVMGGRSGGLYSTTNITEIYDPATDSWTQGSPMPYPVTDYASAVIDNKIYVIGGHDEYLKPHPILPEDMAVSFTQIYDPTTGNWSQGTPIPVYTWQAAAAATTGVISPKRIYVIGGREDGPTASTNNYVYDPAANTWTEAAPMPYRRYLPAIGVFDDILYVVGGGQGYNNTLPENQQYIPIGYNVNSNSPSSSSTSSSHPTISILSPENTTYSPIYNPVATVPLTFWTNASLSWIGYSLDGTSNVTAPENGTEIEIPDGSKSLTLYANDTEGN